MNVELKARLGMEPGEIHFAGGDQEMAVNEMDQAVREIARKIRPEIGGTVFDEAAGYVDARPGFAGEFDVGVSLVIAQKDVEARLVLLDEVVLESESFFLVVDKDVVDVASFGDEGAGLDVGEAIFVEIAANAGAQELGFADVDDLRVGIFV